MASKQDAAARQARELAHRKQFDDLHQLISRSDSLNSSSRHLAEAFVLSAFSGDPSLIGVFVEKGVPINTTHKGTGILHVAARLPNAKMVAGLLDFNPDVDLPDSEAATPLVLAVRQAGKVDDPAEYERSAGLLLGRGADANARDVFSRTALDYACRASNACLAKLLLDGGAQVSQCDDRGTWALKAAVDTPDCKLLALLLKHDANPNCSVGDSEDFTLVRYAAEHGWLDKVKMLVAAGCPATLADGTDIVEWTTQQQDLRLNLLRKLGLA